MVYDFYRAKLEGLGEPIIDSPATTNFDSLAKVLLDLALGKSKINIQNDRYHGPGPWEGMLNMQSHILIYGGTDGMSLQINKDGSFMIGVPG